MLLAGRGVTSILTRLQPIPTSSCTAKHDPVLELAVVQKQDWHASVQHVLPHYGSRPLTAETALLLLWERGRLFVGASGLLTQPFHSLSHECCHRLNVATISIRFVTLSCSIPQSTSHIATLSLISATSCRIVAFSFRICADSCLNIALAVAAPFFLWFVLRPGPDVHE